MSQWCDLYAGRREAVAAALPEAWVTLMADLPQADHRPLAAALAKQLTLQTDDDNVTALAEQVGRIVAICQSARNLQGVVAYTWT